MAGSLAPTVHDAAAPGTVSARWRRRWSGTDWIEGGEERRTIIDEHDFFLRCCIEYGRRGRCVEFQLLSLVYASSFMDLSSLEGMSLDAPDQLHAKPGLVSTHGPRGSRREEWRKSKGMDPVPKRRGMNRQGGLAARRKAGRPSRRR